MVVSKQVNIVKCLELLLGDISRNIKEKFTKFYTKRIFDTDLAPSKTFSYGFDLGTPSSSVHKRSLEKLKTLFIKYISKVNPAISMAANEYMPIDRSSGSITLNLFKLRWGETFPPHCDKTMRSLINSGSNSNFVPDLPTLNTSSAMKDAYFRSLLEVKPLIRYVRYLNYLARKYNIPVKLSVDKVSVQESNLITSPSTHTVYLLMEFTSWYLRNTASYERYLAVQNSGNPDDDLFSRSSLWAFSNLGGNGQGGTDYKYHVANFFLHLDKVLNVLNSLSRKVEYGYSAFTFRTQ